MNGRSDRRAVTSPAGHCRRKVTRAACAGVIGDWTEQARQRVVTAVATVLTRVVARAEPIPTATLPRSSRQAAAPSAAIGLPPRMALLAGAGCCSGE
jgi:hypothetical protein